MTEIVDVIEQNKLAGIASKLFIEYAAELEVDLCFQNFTQEVENPLLKYGAPSGALYVAFYNNGPAGCIALQPVGLAQTCEMKRLYVKAAFRNKGISKKLVEALLKRATELGYKKMVLDTLEKLLPAIELYKRYGFVKTNSYYNNPLSGVIYMSKDL